MRSGKTKMLTSERQKNWPFVFWTNARRWSGLQNMLTQGWEERAWAWNLCWRNALIVIPSPIYEITKVFLEVCFWRFASSRNSKHFCRQFFLMYPKRLKAHHYIKAENVQIYILMYGQFLWKISHFFWHSETTKNTAKISAYFSYQK